MQFGSLTNKKSFFGVVLFKIEMTNPFPQICRVITSLFNYFPIGERLRMIILPGIKIYWAKRKR
jgi:hypothetical protein